MITLLVFKWLFALLFDLMLVCGAVVAEKVLLRVIEERFEHLASILQQRAQWHTCSGAGILVHGAEFIGKPANWTCIVLKSNLLESCAAAVALCHRFDLCLISRSHIERRYCSRTCAMGANYGYHV